MKTHIFAIFVVAAALCLGIPTTWAQHSAHVMITPSELRWSDVPSLPPGATIAVIEGSMNEPVPFTVRIRFPANYKLPAHWHPAVERITVLSGTFNMGVGDELDPQKTTPLTPGSIAIMQPKTHHFAWTTTTTIVQINLEGPFDIFYVNPTDDPQKSRPKR